MLETSARLLRLLSLLQTPREWTGTELADRLGVTTRTVRNDVGRLRDLGYPVHGTRGAVGGYRLGAGAALPPLLLDDEEAVAVAVGLRTATVGSVAGIEESALRALAKLEQVLPSRLRRRINTLQSYTIPVPPRPDRRGSQVSADVLTTITGACRDRERLRFDYQAHDGTTSRREVEPYRLVNWGRRWYLVAWDLHRNAWRTYRVDRMEPRTPTGPRFTARELPAADLAAYVAQGVVRAAWSYQARITVHAPADEIAERLPPNLSPVEAVDENTCAVLLGANQVETLAVWLGALGRDFEFDEAEAPELAEHLLALADRYSRAAGRSRRPAARRSGAQSSGADSE